MTEGYADDDEDDDDEEAISAVKEIIIIDIIIKSLVFGYLLLLQMSNIRLYCAYSVYWHVAVQYCVDIWMSKRCH